MEIIIEGPVFFSQEDESRFFDWLNLLPGFKKVVGEGEYLHLHFNEPLADEAIRQVLIICRRWGIDITPLRGFKTPSNEQFIL